jgi:hypothetical protein
MSKESLVFDKVTALEKHIKSLTENLEVAKQELENLNKLKYNYSITPNGEFLVENFSNEGEGLILEEILNVSYIEYWDEYGSKYYKEIEIKIVDAYNSLGFIINKETTQELINYLTSQLPKLN